MILLLDMDGVLADFHKGFEIDWRAKYPGRKYVPAEEAKNLYITKDYPDEYHDDIWEILRTPGFYYRLQPIEGALEALAYALDSKDVDPYICTAPLEGSRTCMTEKYDWIERYLGYEWTERVFVAKDKTLIYGDILIDDKPEVTGLRDPFWEHVIFTRSYNLQVADKRRLTWSDWKEVLGI